MVLSLYRLNILPSEKYVFINDWIAMERYGSLDGYLDKPSKEPREKNVYSNT